MSASIERRLRALETQNDVHVKLGRARERQFTKCREQRRDLRASLEWLLGEVDNRAGGLLAGTTPLVAAADLARKILEETK